MGDKRVYIMDVYNRHIYPGDRFAKRKLPLSLSPNCTHAWMELSLLSVPYMLGSPEVTSVILSIRRRGWWLPFYRHAN